jgi:tol-pal system protein YbgF
MTRRAGTVAVALLTITGCATRASVRQLHTDLARVSSDVAELKHSQELSISELTRATAEIRALQARSEAVDNTPRQQASAAADNTLRQQASAAAERAPQQGPDDAAPRPAVGPVREEPDDADRLYNAALANFRAREHGQAVLDFMDFIARYPAHPQAPTAQLWVAEAYYEQRDYRQAIIELERVVTMAPTSFVAADALLKIGLAHTMMRENSRAQQAWRRLVREYPGSESAGKARALLREHAARRS